MGELMGQAWVRSYCSPATKARYEKLTAGHHRGLPRPHPRPAVDERGHQGRARSTSSTTSRARSPTRTTGATTRPCSSTAARTRRTRCRWIDWWFHHEAAKLGKPIDRTTWDMITADLQRLLRRRPRSRSCCRPRRSCCPGCPTRSWTTRCSTRYAGGSTIGHEITHGFDDEGRQFDEHGNLNPWWTEQDSAQLHAAREQAGSSSSTTTWSADKHVRGQATLGENIADLGGVVLGYEAFKKTDAVEGGRARSTASRPTSATSWATRCRGWVTAGPKRSRSRS